MRMKLNLMMIVALFFNGVALPASWKSKRKNSPSCCAKKERKKAHKHLNDSLKTQMDVQDAQGTAFSDQDMPLQELKAPVNQEPPSDQNNDTVPQQALPEQRENVENDSFYVEAENPKVISVPSAAPYGNAPMEAPGTRVPMLGESQKTIVEQAHNEVDESGSNQAPQSAIDDDLSEQEYEQDLEDVEVLNPERDDISDIRALQEEEGGQSDIAPDGNLDRFAFDAKAQADSVLELVERGAEFLRKNPIDQAFSTFSHDKKFIKGELYLFVYDTQGTCLAHGQQADLLWQNLYNLKDTFGTFIVQAFIEQARIGGGWVTYTWRNAIKKSYVTQVHKGDKTYVIGAGYYPHSKQDAVVSLVKGAVTNFNSLLKQGHPKEEAFSDYSYLLGKFVYGDLYLYALDFNGLHYAHGSNPGLIGSNAWSYRDADGKYVNQAIIAKLKDTDLGKGIWIDYISKNAPKKAYAEKVVDHEGKYYFIACGFYPDATRDRAVDLTRRGYRYMKANGKTQAVRAFSDKNDDSFRYGDLYLVVYDLKGVCIANGDNPSLIGQNQLEVRDLDGTYYVKDMIKEAVGGGGWTDYKEKNSFRSVYVEKINLGTDSYVIGCGIFPLDKHETMSLMVKSGVDYLQSYDKSEAFREFVKPTGSFIKGDLHLFVFDVNGICLAYGDDHNLIWRNLMNSVDDNGKPQVKMMINAVQRGPNTITYRLNGSTKAVYVAPVEKDGKLYVVGSGFYLY